MISVQRSPAPGMLWEQRSIYPLNKQLAKQPMHEVISTLQGACSLNFLQVSLPSLVRLQFLSHSNMSQVKFHLLNQFRAIYQLISTQSQRLLSLSVLKIDIKVHKRCSMMFCEFTVVRAWKQRLPQSHSLLVVLHSSMADHSLQLLRSPSLVFSSVARRSQDL